MTRLIPASTPDATRVPARRKHGRHIVLVGEVPAGWKPADCADVPPDGLKHSEALATALTLSQALAAAREFNADALRHWGDIEQLWACIIFRPKSPKGGAK